MIIPQPGMTVYHPQLGIGIIESIKKDGWWCLFLFCDLKVKVDQSMVRIIKVSTVDQYKIQEIARRCKMGTF